MQGKELGLRVNTVDTVFRNDAVVVSDVKADHRVIDAVAGTDAGNDDFISARAEIQFFQSRLHRCLIKAIVRGFLNDCLTRQRF